jgi:hypothetical protein
LSGFSPRIDAEALAHRLAIARLLRTAQPEAREDEGQQQAQHDGIERPHERAFRTAAARGAAHRAEIQRARRAVDAGQRRIGAAIEADRARAERRGEMREPVSTPTTTRAPTKSVASSAIDMR